MNPTQPPLLNSLGAAWNFGAPVVGVVWEIEGASAAALLGNGHLARIDAQWPHGPYIEPREEGGMRLVAATESAPHPVRAACHSAAGLALVAHRLGGFLSAGEDGRVVHLPRRGEPVVLVHEPACRIEAVASGAEGEIACTSDAQVWRIGAAAIEAGDTPTDSVDLPAPATAIAFDADGRCLAVAHAGGVTLWPQGRLPRLLAVAGHPTLLAWAPDGRSIAVGTREGALHGLTVAEALCFDVGRVTGDPASSPLSISFSPDGSNLAASGGNRTLCWPFDARAPLGRAVECGVAAKAAVSAVAWHPRLAVIASGHVNGAVVLAHPKSRDGLSVRAAGGGAVSTVAWSPDGSRLAFGTTEGDFGWLAVPDALFRPSATVRTPEETVR